MSLWGSLVKAIRALYGGERKEEPKVAAAEGAVRFEIERAGDGRWMGRFDSEGSTAQFCIELDRTQGRIVPVAGSDSRVFLARLGQAFRAKAEPVPPTEKSTVGFTYEGLGSNLSRGPGGEFLVRPAGDWLACKLFFESADDVAEMYLNLNPRLGVGEFAMKDESYGDLLVATLARAL